MTTVTVAVVEDHERVRDSIVQLLDAADFRVEPFRSAEDFLIRCEQQDGAEIACIVLDVRLPGMSGIALQVELTERGSKIPVILISGHATRQTAEIGLENGAAALLEKPFDGETLVKEVDQAIRAAALVSESISDPSD